MTHECEDCGESFETLTRLRLHDCEDVETDDSSSTSDSDTPASTATDDRTVSVTELDELLDRVSNDELDAIYGTVATFESALSAALSGDEKGDTYRDVFWQYFEPVSNGLDEATRSEGWSLLGDMVAAYDPTEGDAIPMATPAVANAVGRHVIRTRLTDDVEAIPVAALEYLDGVAVNAKEGDDVALEEVHAYGWGIGHPDHSVIDRLHDRAFEAIFSVNPTLEHAFYADQYAAIDALERLVRDDSIEGTLPRFQQEDIPYRRVLLDCVYPLKMDDYWPTAPRYWDWHEEFDFSFAVDETVERRIRDLVAETGFDSDLPDDWTFRDLGI